MEKPKQVFLEVDSDYLLACARIRNVSLTALLRKLVQAIDEDQLVLAVLDDEHNYRHHERYQHRFSMKR